MDGVIRNIRSWLLRIWIDLERVFDHSYRTVFGLPTRRRSQITANLYLGGQYNWQGYRALQQLGITGIVNMRETLLPIGLPDAGRFSGENIPRILHLPTPDQLAPKPEALATGIAFITDEIMQGGIVYIHCHHGEGRGPTMAVAYLISTGLRLADALDLVKQVRVFIKITQEQLTALQEYEQSISVDPLEFNLKKLS